MTDNPPKSPKLKLTAAQKTFAKEMAAQLGEIEKKPIQQIKTLVGLQGEEFVRQLVERTLEIEANGGMMIENGERRRTVGGIFFFLARQALPQEQRDRVFFNWRVAIRRRNTHESKYAPLVWEERKQVLEPLWANQGAASDVRVILLGQPGSIERRQHVVITTFTEQRQELPSMPFGVPAIPNEPMTYVMYASARQWERIQDVVGDPEDPMVVEGYVAFDPEVNAWAVYASYVTTKKTDQREKKQAKVANQSNQAKQANQNGDNKQQKPKKEGGGKQQSAKPQPTAEAPVAAVPEFTIPDNVPPAVAQKLVDLHTAAATFRQKVAALESKPSSQQAGLEMTLKLLKNTEKQIETLEKQYAGRE